MGYSKNYIMYWGVLRLLLYHGATNKCSQSAQKLKSFFVHFVYAQNWILEIFSSDHGIDGMSLPSLYFHIGYLPLIPY